MAIDPEAHTTDIEDLEKDELASRIEQYQSDAARREAAWDAWLDLTDEAQWNWENMGGGFEAFLGQFDGK